MTQIILKKTTTHKTHHIIHQEIQNGINVYHLLMQINTFSSIFFNYLNFHGYSNLDKSLLYRHKTNKI